MILAGLWVYRFCKGYRCGVNCNGRMSGSLPLAGVKYGLGHVPIYENHETAGRMLSAEQMLMDSVYIRVRNRKIHNKKKG